MRTFCRIPSLRGRGLWWAIVISLSTASLSFAGGVQRRLLIRSNPPGATAYVDDYEIGTTPVATSFVYYGTRKIRLVKDGYETLTVLQSIVPPWYEIPPLDLVSENLVPGELRDVRVLQYNLHPQQVVPSSQLLSRAEQLRQSMPSESPVASSPKNPMNSIPRQPLPSGGAPLPNPAAAPMAPTPAAPPPALPMPPAAPVNPPPVNLGPATPSDWPAR